MKSLNLKLPWIAVLCLLAIGVVSVGATAAEVQHTAMTIEAGTGKVITLATPVANIFVADPKVAEVRPASPTALFIFGLNPGRTTVAIMDAEGAMLGSTI